MSFARSSNYRCNNRAQISAVTWRTVHEHIVADAFRSKKILSGLLVNEQQASLKCLSSCHSTACGDCRRKILKCFAHTACAQIYLSLAVTTSSWITLRAQRVCYYMFMNSSPCYCSYCTYLLICMYILYICIYVAYIVYVLYILHPFVFH